MDVTLHKIGNVILWVNLLKAYAPEHVHPAHTLILENSVAIYQSNLKDSLRDKALNESLRTNGKTGRVVTEHFHLGQYQPYALEIVVHVVANVV